MSLDYLLTSEVREYAPSFGVHDYISHGFYTLDDALFTLKSMEDAYRSIHALRRSCKRSFHYDLPDGEQRRIVFIKHVAYEGG